MYALRKRLVREVSHKWLVTADVLPLYNEGKDLEVRVKNGYPERVRTRDVLFINKRLWRRVIAIRSYPSFEAMLVFEDYRRMYPRAESEAHVLALLRETYPPHMEKKGVLVFELIGN